jgi:hypothetical protein
VNARLCVAVGMILAAGSGFVRAQGVTTFESCTDAAGRILPAVEDTSLTRLVVTSHDKGGAVIRYNPSVLTRLKPATRLFFFAHECARNALGDGRRTSMSVARSQQADCLGLATMLDGGFLKREDIPELQADLSFSEAEWAALPGLPRNFDLANCHSPGVVKLPETPPSGDKANWSACVRTCAAPLLACGNGCLDNYNKCIAGCGGKDK